MCAVHFTSNNRLNTHNNTKIFSLSLSNIVFLDLLQQFLNIFTMTDMLKIRTFNFYLDKDKINTTQSHTHTQFFVCDFYNNV